MAGYVHSVVKRKKRKLVTGGNVFHAHDEVNSVEEEQGKKEGKRRIVVSGREAAANSFSLHFSGIGREVSLTFGECFWTTFDARDSPIRRKTVNKNEEKFH
jgi:hypothetical protein